MVLVSGMEGWKAEMLKVPTRQSAPRLDVEKQNELY